MPQMDVLGQSRALWKGVCVRGCVSTCVALCVPLTGVCYRKGVPTGVYCSLVCLWKLCSMLGVRVCSGLCVSCVDVGSELWACPRYGHRTNTA